jgi:hypothetical protein
MGVIAGLLQSFQFGSYAAPEQGSLEAWGVEVGSNRLIDSVENSGDGGESIGFEDLEVFE